MVKLELYGAIGFDVTAADFVRQLDAAGDALVRIHINSEGGAVSDANAIYSRIVAREGRTECVIDGLAASAATLVAMACDFITMPHNAQMMIHNAWTQTAGNASELRQSADMLEKTSDAMANIYAARAGLPLESIKALLADETWLSADECRDLGLCDAVTSPTKPTALAVAMTKRRLKRALAQAGTDAGDLPSPILKPDEEKSAMEENEAPEEMPAEESEAEEPEAMEEGTEEEPAAMSPEEEADALRAALQFLQSKYDELASALEANRAEVDEQMERAEAAEAALAEREMTDAGIAQDDRPALARLRSADVDLYQKTLAMMASATGRNDVQARIGRPGDVARHGAPAPEEILAEARELGIDYGEGLTAWLRTNYPDQRATVAAMARAQFHARN